ncbi:hypothetical protein BpHYR1_008957 [Brachionus plicatilis]|uniref:Uncharacterized protein n=1 Tax=Brachionus plicatilis TaxID=10195 RepID=A0A3M7SE15_BRAPC|nr:hypothetical protein BpHYR1_008957 [Brachionus plicatilis]
MKKKMIANSGDVIPLFHFSDFTLIYFLVYPGFLRFLKFIFEIIDVEFIFSQSITGLQTSIRFDFMNRSEHISD